MYGNWRLYYFKICKDAKRLLWHVLKTCLKFWEALDADWRKTNGGRWRSFSSSRVLQKSELNVISRKFESCAENNNLNVDLYRLKSLNKKIDPSHLLKISNENRCFRNKTDLQTSSCETAWRLSSKKLDPKFHRSRDLPPLLPATNPRRQRSWLITMHCEKATQDDIMFSPRTSRASWACWFFLKTCRCKSSRILCQCWAKVWTDQPALAPHSPRSATDDTLENQHGESATKVGWTGSRYYRIVHTG